MFPPCGSLCPAKCCAKPGSLLCLEQVAQNTFDFIVVDFVPVTWKFEVPLQGDCMDWLLGGLDLIGTWVGRVDFCQNPGSESASGAQKFNACVCGGGGRRL